MIADLVPRVPVTEVVRVLMIEDSAADARLVTEYLLESEPRRFAVTNAQMLRDALDLLRSREFDVIILDLGLPDSQGLETLRRIRARAARMPIIVLTGLDDEATGIEAVNSGAQDYLVKGASTGQLLRHSVVFAIERARVEAIIRERDERFRQLADNMREVFFVIDANFRETLYVSPGYEQVWGMPCQMLYDRPTSFLDAVLPEDLGIVRENIARVQGGEDAGEIEFRIIHPDGQRRWVQTHAMPVRDSSGAVYRIAGVGMDITDRRQAIEALAENERRFRLISESSFDGFAISENGIIQEVNNGYARIFGYSPEAMVGMPIDSLVAQESLEVAQQGLKIETYDRREFVCKHRDGHSVRIEATVNSYRSAGRLIRVSAVRDITERFNLQRQYRQAQKMEAVGRLAGGVAHDFNNLLTVIGSYAGLVLQENSLNAAVRDDIEQIVKAADSAAGLTRQLLTFSRQHVLQLTSLDLNDVVRDAGKLLRRVIGEDIELTMKLDAHIAHVEADFFQLEQVVMNMAVNARDAMPEGGTLRIETAVATLAEDMVHGGMSVRAGEYVLLTLADTGTGMDEETKLQIFEPFFTTKEAGHGTGLGLAMVFGIVQQAGGLIKVDSELGGGTRFEIYLPRAAEAPVPREVAAPLLSLRGTETILLVEDVPALREIVRRLLVGLGYAVLDATSAPGAMLRAEKFKGRIHLLLTDVVLPGMSGRHLAEKLAETRPEMKVLFTSGYTNDAVLRAGVHDHEFAFLQKPFSAEMLGKRVREVLGPPAKKS